MGKSYSADLRVRNFGTCVGGVRASGRSPGAAKLASHLPLLIGWVEAQRDIGMPELVARLSAEKKGQGHHDVAGPGAAWRTLQIFRYKDRLQL